VPPQLVPAVVQGGLKGFPMIHLPHNMDTVKNLSAKRLSDWSRPSACVWDQ